MSPVWLGFVKMRLIEFKQAFFDIFFMPSEIVVGVIGSIAIDFDAA
jgi:hypothetical protein